jgi:hypothetical protein
MSASKSFLSEALQIANHKPKGKPSFKRLQINRES